jgi:tagatose 6-phosphate kinase
VTGLAGGRTGEALADGLAGTGITVELTPIAGETRRTFVVVDSVRGQTALFNEPGPAVSAAEYERFFVAYEKALASSAAVVLSGSLPPGVPAEAYAGLIAAAAGTGVRAVLDASGAGLAYGAAAGPAVVKPNLAELEAVAGHKLRTDEAAAPDLPVIERAARALAGPATSVVVSLGPDGLLAVGPDGTWHARPPGHVPGNPTGAGDAVVAGLADSLVRGQDWPATLRHAAALGTAAAAAPVAGAFGWADYERLVTTVQVTGAGQERG